MKMTLFQKNSSKSSYLTFDFLFKKLLIILEVKISFLRCEIIKNIAPKALIKSNKTPKISSAFISSN